MCPQGDSRWSPSSSFQLDYHECPSRSMAWIFETVRPAHQPSRQAGKHGVSQPEDADWPYRPYTRSSPFTQRVAAEALGFAQPLPDLLWQICQFRLWEGWSKRADIGGYQCGWSQRLTREETAYARQQTIINESCTSLLTVHLVDAVIEWAPRQQPSWCQIELTIHAPKCAVRFTQL